MAQKYLREINEQLVSISDNHTLAYFILFLLNMWLEKKKMSKMVAGGRQRSRQCGASHHHWTGKNGWVPPMQRSKKDKKEAKIWQFSPSFFASHRSNSNWVPIESIQLVNARDVFGKNLSMNNLYASVTNTLTYFFFFSAERNLNFKKIIIIIINLIKLWTNKPVICCSLIYISLWSTNQLQVE